MLLLSVILFVLVTNFTYAADEFPINKVIGSRLGRGFQLESILCSRNSTVKHCRCDDECGLTNECCIDKFWDPKIFAGVDNYLDFLIIRGKQKREKITRQVKRDLLPEHLLKHSNITFNKRIQLNMIDSCNVGASLNEKLLCGDATKITPQFAIPVKSHDGTIYKNSFCATCNGETDYEYLNITITCPVSNTDCWLGDTYTSKTYSTCGQGCQPRSDQRTHNLCLSYGGLIKGYHNLHCAECMNRRRKCILKRISWSVLTSLKKKEDDLVTERIRVDEGDDDVPQGKYYVQFCSAGKIYDAATKSCVDFSCNKGFQKAGMRCVKLTQHENVDNCPPINHTINHMTTHRDEDMTIYVETKKDTDVELLKTVLKNIFNLRGQEVVNSVMNNTYALIIFDNQTTVSNVNNLLKDNTHIWQYATSVYMSTTVYGTKHQFKRNFLESHKTCAAVSEHINISDFKHCHVASAVKIEFSPTGEIRRGVAYCTVEYLKENCPLRFISRMNYSIDKNLTLYEHATQERYPVDQYKVEAGGVSVCVLTTPHQHHPSNENDWKEIVLLAESYITVIGTLTSIFAVIFLLVFLVKDSEEMTVPKLNNVLLCLALLLSDCLFMGSIRASHDEKTCQGVAIVLHWSLLVLHFIVAVISWDFTMRVAQLKASPQYQKRKVFYRYCMFALLLPTVIVVVCVILDQTHLQHFGYGKMGNMCWINDFSSRLVTYIVPTIFISLGSGGMLAYALRQIHLVGSQNQSVMNNKQRKRYGARTIALKLVFFLGLLEIISIIQIEKDKLTVTEEIVNTVFRMMFVTLRSLRGVIIWFFLFLCNTQKNLLKNLSTSKLSLSRRFSAS